MNTANFLSIPASIFPDEEILVFEDVRHVECFYEIAPLFRIIRWTFFVNRTIFFPDALSQEIDDPLNVHHPRVLRPAKVAISCCTNPLNVML